MSRTHTTPEGKTWAGRVAEVPPELLAPLERAVREIGWTGGAEIEMLRDLDGRRWFLECNPRFPAWVHGASLSGRNLPARWCAACWGCPTAARALTDHAEFTRVVLEVPVRAELPLPLPFEPEHGNVVAGSKYGGALEAMVPMLAPAGGGGGRRDATAATAASPRTPSRRASRPKPRPICAPRARLASAAPAVPAAHGAGDVRARRTPPRRRRVPRSPALRFAYSLKTSPDPEY